MRELRFRGGDTHPPSVRPSIHPTVTAKSGEAVPFSKRSETKRLGGR